MHWPLTCINIDQQFKKWTKQVDFSNIEQGFIDYRCLFLTATHKDTRPYYCFSPILCVLGLWDKSTRCCPVCIKTKPLTSWSGPEDVKEMIAAPELQTEFHYPQWVQKHTSNVCMRSHILPRSDLTLICFCEQGHWHPILIRHWFRWSWWEECLHWEGQGICGLWHFWLSRVFTRFHKVPLNGLLPLFHWNGSGANNWPGIVNFS